MNVTVFGKPNCGACTATKVALEKQGTPYEYVNVEELGDDAEEMDVMRRFGYSSVPVVLAGDDHWSGFRPDRIKALKNA